MNLFVVFFTLPFFISCTIQAPRFISDGIKMEEAISFVELLQEKTPDQLDLHVQYLSKGNYAPGFKWTQYWNEIKQKKLYTKWSQEEREKIFSLSEVSCSTENWTAFTSLLIEIALLDSEQPVFKKYTSNPTHPCSSTWVSNAITKQIVDILSQKRREKEVYALNQLKSQDSLTNLYSKPAEEINKNNFKTLTSDTTGTVYLYTENTEVEEQYPYTLELQSFLVNEWIQNRRLRSWSFILKDVDKSFWQDVRLINYKSGDLSFLKNTLEIEFSEYGVISGLDKDILLMFRQSSSMSKLIELMNYNRYFRASFMDWETLWEYTLNAYPSKPQSNNNIQDLMSLRLFSCQRDDIVAYLRFAQSWNMKVRDIHWKGSIIVANWCVSRVGIQDEYSFKNVKSFFAQELEDELLPNVDRLIRAYTEEKHIYPASEWRKLIEEYFLESDWLELTKQLRSRKDNLFIQSVLDMHEQVYGGSVPFLAEDILLVLVSEEESLVNLLELNPYRSYLSKLHTINSFWVLLSSRIDEMNDSSWEDLFEYAAVSCDSNYFNALFEWLSRENRLYRLFDHFNFYACKDISLKDSIREEILDFSISQVREEYLPNTSSKNKSTVWQLAYIMSLQKTNDINQAILKMNSIEWNVLLQKMLYTVHEPEFSGNSDLLINLLYNINNVYDRITTQSICNFLNQKESYRIISEYDSEVLINLLNYLEKRDIKSSKSQPGYCYSERMNVILFVTGYLLFDNINKDLSPKKYVIHIWNEALRVIGLRENFMSPLDKDSVTLSAKRYVHSWGLNWLEYDQESVQMDDFSFYLYFSTLILDMLSKKMHIIEAVDHLKRDQNQDFADHYYSLIREFMKNFNENQVYLHQLLKDNLLLR